MSGKAVIGIARTLFLSVLGRQDAKGVAKYGQSLHTWNGRNPLDDAHEELADAWQYVTQARLERAYVHDGLARWLRAQDAYRSVSNDGITNEAAEFMAATDNLERVARKVVG